MSHILSVHKLSKTFGKQRIINDLSFSIKQGDRVTVFAPSGSGKTTLIHILSSLDQEFSGSFSLTAQQPATIFQEARLFSYMTVQENIFFPLRIRKIPMTDSLRQHYEQWLEVCSLTAYKEHYPYQISGGMKQKVSLIRSFITNPDFVMMDEPFKSLDFHSKNQIIRHIIQHYPNITILFVTHNLDEIPLFAKSLLVFPASPLTTFIRHADIAEIGVSELFSRIFEELSS